MRHGVKPAKVDRRDYSFHKTFPHFGQTAPAELPLMNYSIDAGLTMYDQNADGYPYGCTGYTQTDCKADQDKAVYLPSFTYKKTCEMEGHAADQGCDIRISAKSLRVYGALPLGKGSDQDAIEHKSGKTFNVDKAPGRDWFDSFRIALRAQYLTPKQTSISVGTPWPSEWAWPTLGVLPDFEFSGNIDEYSWHNYKLCGEKLINGKPHMIVKSWQGKNYGDDGWAYLSREVFNKAFDIYGTMGITVRDVHPEDVQMISLDIYQTILIYINRILALIGREVPVHA